MKKLVLTFGILSKTTITTTQCLTHTKTKQTKYNEKCPRVKSILWTGGEGEWVGGRGVGGGGGGNDVGKTTNQNRKKEKKNKKASVTRGCYSAIMRTKWR